MPAPTIDEITVADPPERWRAAGFRRGRGRPCEVGTVRIRLAGPGGAGDRGLVGARRGGARLDGLPTTVSERRRRRRGRTRTGWRAGSPGGDEPRASTARRGAASAPASTCAACARAHARRRDAPGVLPHGRGDPRGGGGAARARACAPIRTVPARFWGLAFGVESLEHTVGGARDQLGASRGRRFSPGAAIATLRRRRASGRRSPS